MKLEEITAAMEAVKTVFPGTTMYQLLIEMENGKMALIKFNKEDVGEATEFTLVPAGQYTAQITNHEWKETKKGGHLLALTLEITGPSHEGRKVFDNLNLDNDNDLPRIPTGVYRSMNRVNWSSAKNMIYARNRRTREIVTSTPQRSQITPLCLIRLYLPQAHS